MNRRTLFKALFGGLAALKSSPAPAVPKPPRIKIKRYFNAIPEVTIAGERGDFMVELPGIFCVHPKTHKRLNVPRLVMLTGINPTTFYPHVILDGRYQNAWADPEMYEVIE